MSSEELGNVSVASALAYPLEAIFTIPLFIHPAAPVWEEQLCAATEGIAHLNSDDMADKDTVEKFLDNNPQVAKEYYEKKVKADVITAAFGAQVQVKDPASYKDVTTIQEAEFMFELIKELQGADKMEKALHKVLQRIALLIQADRCSYWGFRARNGTPELSSILFDVTHNSSYDKNIVNPNVEIVFPTDMGLVGWTAHSKKPQNIIDVKKVS